MHFPKLEKKKQLFNVSVIYDFQKQKVDKEMLISNALECKCKERHKFNVRGM